MASFVRAHGKGTKLPAHRRASTLPHAPAWNPSYSYFHEQPEQQPTRKFKTVKPSLIKKFQLWIENKREWNSRITSKPILLFDKDIIQWHHFKAQRLKQNQLYLWRSSFNEWVPLWSLERGFLLKDMNFIRYSDVTHEQFLREKWTRINSVSTQQIAQLLGRFNESLEKFAGSTNSFKQSTSKNRTQTITGSPYYCSDFGIYPTIPIFNEESRGWSKYCIYSKMDHRYHYEFIKYYHTTYHQSTQAMGNMMVHGFSTAAQRARNGYAYVYHQDDIFVPFWKIDRNTIQLNSGHFLKISTINPDAKKIQHVTKNRHNTISKQEYDEIRRVTKQIFIDAKLMKYRIEFIQNCVGCVSYKMWSKAKKLNKIAPAVKASDTLFLLTPDGLNGFPVGLSPNDEDCFLLDNGTYMSLPNLQKAYKENQIDIGIALDFNGIEQLVNGDGIHPQFQQYSQQVARIDGLNLQKIQIQGFLAGQFILLDFGTDYLLPVYILNNFYVRSQSMVVHIQDLAKFYSIALDQGDFIKKSNIKLESNFISLASQDETIFQSNNSQTMFNLPDLNVQTSPANVNLHGMMPKEQSDMIQQATANAAQKVTDHDQFGQYFQQRQNTNQNKNQNQSQPQNQNHQHHTPRQPEPVPNEILHGKQSKPIILQRNIDITKLLQKTTRQRNIFTFGIINKCVHRF